MFTLFVYLSLESSFANVIGHHFLVLFMCKIDVLQAKDETLDDIVNE